MDERTAHPLTVIVDLKGNVFYLKNTMKRGWWCEENVQPEAQALESRIERRFSVVNQRELPA